MYHGNQTFFFVNETLKKFFKENLNNYNLIINVEEKFKIK